MAKQKAEGRKDPKEYMKLAVAVMKKSIPERKKKNPSPYVGAVLVFPDGTIDTAYRGEQREGNHAEYVVLDRKNSHRDLTGCWLFATLEPCAKGAKTGKKKSPDHLNERAVATDMDNLSEIALQKFISESKRKYKPLSAEQLRELKEMDLLEYDSKAKKYLPTGNAILLFGKAPRNKFPQAAVKAKVHYGDGKTGTETFDNALVLVPDEVEDWLKKVLPASIDRSKFKAQQVHSFPIPVIREAVINAIAHRDYSKDGAKVQLEVFPDRIVVKSPGEPPPPITIEAMRNFTATSYSRNKKLTFIFNEMDYMEETALGMDTFKAMRSEHHLPLPIIDYDRGNVVVTFLRTGKAVKGVANKALGKLTEEEFAGYEFVKLKGEVSKKEYAEHFGFNEKKAQRHLMKMKNLKLIGDNGESPKSNNYKYLFND